MKFTIVSYCSNSFENPIGWKTEQTANQNSYNEQGKYKFMLKYIFVGSGRDIA